MAVYAVGDVQGCRVALDRLLDRLRFDSANDRLWLTGDLVRRGPDSLGVLRRVYGLGDAAVCVLGNHDLHLLAQAAGFGPGRGREAAEVLAAADGPTLLAWLQGLPLLHRDPSVGASMVHAGLLPAWTLDRASELAGEVEAVLRSEQAPALYAHMYGNEPRAWSPALDGWERLRVIVNAMTRLRYCDLAGNMDLDAAGPPGSQAREFMPWFQVPGRKSAGERIYFGHWSTLGLGGAGGAQGLDTGCVWGGHLTAVQVDDPDRPPIQVECGQEAVQNR